MIRKWIIALFLFCGGAAVFAVELGATLGVIGSTPVLNELFGTDAETMAVNFAGNVQADIDVSDTMGLTIAAEHDPVLKTRIMPVLGFAYSLIDLKIGPFMGFSDLREGDVNPGITLTFDVTAPGIVFGYIRFDTSIGGGSIAPRNFTQELWEAKVGFWTSNIIFSLGAQNRSFSAQNESIYTSRWTRYILSLDFFQKNIPRTWRFDFGFQKLKWLPYERPAEGYEYGSFFLGAEFHVQVNYTVEIILGAEGSLFSWNMKDAIVGKSQRITLFETRLGLVWGIGE